MNQPLTLLVTFMVTFIFLANVLWLPDFISLLASLGAIALVYAVWPPRPEEESL